MTYVFLRQSARGIPVLIGTLICARFPKRPYYSTRGQLVHIYSGIVRSLIQERAIKQVPAKEITQKIIRTGMRNVMSSINNTANH